MANLVLSEDRLPAADEAAVTPKLYCKLHDDYLDDIGIYDIDGLFALVFGHAEGPSTSVVASSTSSVGSTRRPCRKRATRMPRSSRSWPTSPASPASRKSRTRFRSRARSS